MTGQVRGGSSSLFPWKTVDVIEGSDCTEEFSKVLADIILSLGILMLV